MRRRGFTLIELMVVIAVIGILLSLTLPAIHMVREQARQTDCRNNLKQISTALEAYTEATGGVLPPSVVFGFDAGRTDIFTWGIHGRLLPHLEQNALFDHANYSIRPESFVNSTVTNRYVGIFTCPSDIRRRDGAYEIFGAKVWGTNYGWMVGNWFVAPGLGPKSISAVPTAPFFVNSSVRRGAILDGAGKTIFNAEVRINQRFYACGKPLKRVNDPYILPSPNENPYVVGPEYGTGCGGRPVDPDFPPPPDTSIPEIGHAEWFDGRVHHSGVTSAWPPNMETVRTLKGQRFDVDLIGYLEHDGALGPTFAAFTARSYHAGGVNAMFGDGSVRFMSNSIDGDVWRALSTIAGGETNLNF